MITLEALRAYGADVDEGLSRCLGKEDFYLKMVNMGMQDARFITLKAALESRDLQAAFEQAHALKGIVGNLSLTPLFTLISELTELLRNRTEADYLSLYDEIKAQYERLCALA